MNLIIGVLVFWAGCLCGILLAIYLLERRVIDVPYIPSRAYGDDFAEHLSGRVYDQDRILAPQQQRPIAERWGEYRDAS
jgi:hypothetical protein